MVIVFIDEIFVKIHGKPHYFCQAVDQDGEVVDALIQKCSNGR